MKPYQLSDDRTVTVKKKEGLLTVIIKQKESEEKFIEFTPNRYDITFVYIDCATCLVPVADYVYFLLIVLLILVKCNF